MSFDNTTFDPVYKLIIIGDSGTGKSCILHQFIEGEFKKGPTKHTIGVEFGTRSVSVSDKTVKLQLWDTAGQERFRSVCHSYYRTYFSQNKQGSHAYHFVLGGAMGALVVYDITKQETFDNLPRWIEDARALAGNDICIALCGNKADLEGERQVDLLEASRYAQECNALFLETSALNGQNIKEVFHMCARAIAIKIDAGVLSMPIPHDGDRNNLQDHDTDRSCYC